MISIIHKILCHKKFINYVKFLSIITILIARIINANSPHDLLTNNRESDYQTNKCTLCHVQNNKEKVDLLWVNLHETVSMVKDFGQFENVSLTSLKCLGCHDGAAAKNNLPNGVIGYELASIDNYSGVSNITNKNTIKTKNGYNDLGNNHPVGIIYDETNPELKSINELKIAKLEDGTNRITCATCHEPHNNSNKVEYLAYINEGSSLCLDCHIK